MIDRRDTALRRVSLRASRIFWVLAAACLAPASPAWPCSVCFGAGDPDAAGFAWGVLILLLPVALVQIVLLRFLVRAARREGAVAPAAAGRRHAARRVSS